MSIPLLEKKPRPSTGAEVFTWKQKQSNPIITQYSDTTNRNIGNIEAILGKPFSVSSFYTLKAEREIQQKVTVEDAMRNEGIIPPSSIVHDGNIHRFPTNGDSADDAGWYVIYPEMEGGFSAGTFGDWRNGSKFNYRSREPQGEVEQQYYSTKIAEAQKTSEACRAAGWEETASRAAKEWENATEAMKDHPYLVGKGVKPHGIRQQGGTLILPFYNGNGEITTIEKIHADGTKRFLKGGRKKGSFFTIGEPQEGGRMFLVEGYSTGATVFEATGQPVVVAGDAGNMALVAETIREQHPTTEIVVIADNDKSKTGQQAAQKAARACLGRFIVPPIEGCDANDLAKHMDVKTWIEQELAVQTVREAEGLKKSSINMISAEAERTADIPPRRWFVDGLLTVGFCVLSARKATGKSMLAMQMAYAIASGGIFLGKECSKAKVLYITTELDQTAIHERLNMFGPAPENLFIHYGWANGDEGISLAENAIQEHGVEVAIIDMFTGVLPKNSETNSYDMTPFYLKWRQMAQRNKAAVIGVWHNTKTSSDDPINNVLGSTGLAGQADSVLVVERKRTSAETKIFIGGNHGKETTIKARFEFPLFHLVAEGESNEPSLAPADRLLYDALYEHGPASVAMIASIVGKETAAVRTGLARLKNKGLAEKAGNDWAISEGVSDVK